MREAARAVAKRARRRPAAGRMNILLTNRRRHLRAALSSCGWRGRRRRVNIVAPDRDQSATSHSLTLNRPVPH